MRNRVQWGVTERNPRILVASSALTNGLEGPRRDLPKLLRFECLDVLDAVGDAAAKLQIGWPEPLPSPSFEGAGAELPAPGELDLAQMGDDDVRDLLS
jgi:hypothetical protein